MDALQHVGGELFVARLLVASADSCVDRLHLRAAMLLSHTSGERGLRRDRLLQVEHGSQRVVLHDHEIGGILGCGLALGDHDRHRLACEDDLFLGERLRRTVAAASAGQRKVLRGEHGDDAGHRERLFGVDAPDERVCLPAEDESRMEQPGDLLVGGIAGRAGHLLWRVDSRPGNAYELAHAPGLPSARSRASASARRTTTAARWRRYSAGANRSSVTSVWASASSGSTSVSSRNGLLAMPVTATVVPSGPVSAAAPASANPDAGCSTET